MCQKGLFVFLKTPEVELDAKKQELQETFQAEQVCIKPLLIPSLLQVRFSLLRHRTPKQAVHKSKQSWRQELMDWEQLRGSETIPCWECCIVHACKNGKAADIDVACRPSPCLLLRKIFWLAARLRLCCEGIAEAVGCTCAAKPAGGRESQAFSEPQTEPCNQTM